MCVVIGTDDKGRETPPSPPLCLLSPKPGTVQSGVGLQRLVHLSEPLGKLSRTLSGCLECENCLEQV